MELEWQYSRNQRKHWIDDGEHYDKPNYHHWARWEICSAAPYGFKQGKYGYDLYHKGKHIKHGKTVKELKQIVVESEE